MTDDLAMRVDEHRRAADGARPLHVGKPLAVGQRFRGLTAELLEHGQARECWSVRYARYLSKGGRPVPPPSHCRLVIVPGDHYILWTEHDPDRRPTGRTEAYCAPCAIAEWKHADVREAAS